MSSLRKENLRKSRRVLIGVSGGIAVYKICEVARELVENGLDVHIIMTPNATKFISPLTFTALTGNRVLVDEFADYKMPDDYDSGSMYHIQEARGSEIFLIAPATVNTIAKLAHGIADNLLTSTALAFRGPIVFAPTMNSAMWENPVTQENVTKLQQRGMIMVEPGTGYLACGEVGPGRLAEPRKILQVLLNQLNLLEGPLSGVNVLVTGGATREFIDPVRFVSNSSTGTLALICADMLFLQGAKVTFVASPSIPNRELEQRGYNFRRITSAKEMYEVVTESAQENDVLVMLAGVADYTSPISNSKIKKDKHEKLSLSLTRTDDILQSLKKINMPSIRIGVSLDTSDVLNSAKNKLLEKDLSGIIAVSLEEGQSPFGEASMKSALLTTDGAVIPFGYHSKEEIGEALVTLICSMVKRLRREK